MRSSIIWKTAFRSIIKNKRRSLLTMIGIIIGIASVITIVAIGNGFKRNILSTMNVVDNEPNTRYINLNYFNVNDLMSLDKGISKADLEIIQSTPGVASVDYYRMSKDNGSVSLNFIAKNKKLSLSAQLVENTNALEKPVALLAGRSLNKADSDTLNKVTVIDEVVATRLYDSIEQALGKGFQLGNQIYTIVGITQNVSGDISPTNYEPLAFFPPKTYTFYQGNKTEETSVILKMKKNSSYDAVMGQVLAQLNANGDLRAIGEYQAYDPMAEMKGLGDMLNNLTLFISLVAGISLFIAGVGVMNMMYISVAERTKEIGIRRALGATSKEIKRQFLNEGIALTLTGGLIGYLLGMLIAAAVSLMLPFSVAPDLPTVMIAITTSVLIGVAFSYLPASSAAKKELIDILK
ncbi:ABC transporter permease [Candidatus Enterococcus clewellii]|uniref:Permease n=1 Tax=Candidatus Enterococcus clewellii TaxID=1834193 RepID=A0A242JWU7_9ENTE|nr:ABC transporter permease [Enterococcus sp. 9E7_DIV0242]OTP09788.1 hypothetical protein A5888_003984 [Enterococcus sp. 9E7_DIV0242]